MKCPYCEFLDSKVVDSRPTDEGQAIRRRRECIKCGKRFTTYEKFEEIPIMVVKKDGNRQSYNRNKLLNGIIKSCEKRPVSINTIEKIVDDIEKKLSNSLEKEVTSIEIGEMVMNKLPVDFSSLDDRYQCFVKLHPAVNLTVPNHWETSMTTTELLLISDVIITDYSSLAMEASFLNIPVLFYNYDIEKYNQKRGLVDHYYDYIGRESIRNNDELIQRITDTLKPNETLNQLWNEYNKGDATLQLMKFINEES